MSNKTRHFGRQDSDLKKALEECNKSIRHYQEALALDPGFHQAAENIELVRLVLKTILDEINRQKKAQEQQNEAMQRAAEQLKELISRQKAYNEIERIVGNLELHSTKHKLKDTLLRTYSSFSQNEQ